MKVSLSVIKMMTIILNENGINSLVIDGKKSTNLLKDLYVYFLVR